MLDTFNHHLDVLWGFLVALAVVLVLPPAAGGAPRRPPRRPVPRLGGVGLFLAVIVPALAFLPLDGPYRGILLGAALAVSVGVVDGLLVLPWGAEAGGEV